MRIERETHLNFPARDVLAWLQRPGALVRLTPPGIASIDKPEEGGFDEGRVVTSHLGPPVLPRRVRPRWVMRHDEGHLPAGDEARARFVDRQLTGPFVGWRHEHEISESTFSEHTALSDGYADGTLMTDVLEVKVHGPAFTEAVVRPRIEAILDFRERQLRDDLAFWSRYTVPSPDGNSRPFTVAVSGASGLVGTQVMAFLRTGGVRVVPMRRSGKAGSAAASEATQTALESGHAPQEILWDPDRGVLDPRDLHHVDAIIHLAGAPISTRFTEKNKRKILRSRVVSTELIARTLASLADGGHGPRTLVHASAIGAYGAQRPGEVLTEDDPGGRGFLADVVRQWEAAAQPAIDAGVRTVSVRTGIVLSDGGGALLPQLPLFFLGAGGRLAAKDAVNSWITLDDLVRVYGHALLTEGLEGPLNAVAPNPATAEEMARTLGRVLQRPALLPVPSFGPKLLLGAEGAKELVQADQRVSDKRLRASGFVAAHPQLEQALRHVLHVSS